MEQEKEKITEIPNDITIKLSTEPRGCATHVDLERHGIMADPGRTGRFPGSRDWNMEGMITCLRKTCAACYFNLCAIPSRIKINAQGKCEGYYPAKKKLKKKTKKVKRNKHKSETWQREPKIDEVV